MLRHRLAVLSITIAACGTGGRAESRAPADAYHGAELVQPFAAPDFVLPATDGRPYRFKAETAGYAALLFFGYTHCPDVCPVHLSNLASVLGRLPLAVSGRVKVVFVTVDPARDTPRVLRAWLDRFSRGFVGLRGSQDAVAQIQRQLHLPTPAIERLPSGGYVLGHGAAVLAIVADSVRVLYPFGIRQADWLHDLPKLVAAIPRASGASAGREVD